MKPRIWTTVGDLRWLRLLELSHNFCRAHLVERAAALPHKAAAPTVRNGAINGRFETFHQGFSPVREFLVFDRLTLFEVLRPARSTAEM
jgi:hypothetical protein